MPEGARLKAITVDLAVNTLRLELDDGIPAGEAIPERATIDIGTGGRLVGVDLASGYVEVMGAETGTEHLTRSAIAEVGVERERGSGELLAVTVPRRGAGYEITYPSGNQ